MSKINNVLHALKNGEELTAKQITSRYGIKNAHDAIYQLRSEGYSIYCNPHKDSKGRESNKYRLGTPSRKMVATAFAVLGGAAFV